jgi:hypothetical protein
LSVGGERLRIAAVTTASAALAAAKSVASRVEMLKVPPRATALPKLAAKVKKARR